MTGNDYKRDDNKNNNSKYQEYQSTILRTSYIISSCYKVIMVRHVTKKVAMKRLIKKLECYSQWELIINLLP